MSSLRPLGHATGSLARLLFIGFLSLLSSALHAGAEPSLPPVKRETPRWVLRYPDHFHKLVRWQWAEEKLNAASDFIEENFGPFKEAVDVEIVRTLRSPAKSSVLRRGIGGLAGVRNQKAFVIIKLSALTESRLRHELFHAWLRQQGLRPPQGLEEGLAELLEGPFNRGMYEILTYHGGPLPLIDNPDTRLPPGKRERHRRASYWLAFFHLKHTRPGLSLRDLLKKELVFDTREAWSWLQHSDFIRRTLTEQSDERQPFGR